MSKSNFDYSDFKRFEDDMLSDEDKALLEVEVALIRQQASAEEDAAKLEEELITIQQQAAAERFYTDGLIDEDQRYI